MFLRIFLFGSAVVGLLVVALVWAVINGQYEAAQPTPVPSSSASGVPAPSGSQAAESASAGASAGASAAASGSVEASPAASGATTTVTITNSNFGPDITIAPGTAVTFDNADPLPHTATEGSNGVKVSDAHFDLQLPPGSSESYTFADAGDYKVTCTLHPQMNMTITVQ
jgi:plastocyanin